MKTLIAGLTALCLVGIASVSWAGDVYVVDKAKGKRPMVTQKDGYTRNAVPFTNGGPNQGYSSAMMFATPGHRRYRLHRARGARRQNRATRGRHGLL